MLALEMKNWMICDESFQQALDFCVKPEEGGRENSKTTNGQHALENFK